MKITNISWIWLFGIIAAGCYDEGKITPTPEPEAVYGKYTLPQGNHDYDPEILEIYKKYNTLLLYKFEDKDYWWAVSEDIRWKYQEGYGTVLGYEAAPADENYVGQQITLIKEKFLKYFPDTLLNRTLPQKILLTRYFNYIPPLSNYPTEEDKIHLNAYWGFDYIGVSWGNESILTMDADDLNAFKSDLCKVFLQNSANRTMGRSPKFFTISSYASGTSNTLEEGFVDPEMSVNVDEDWNSYIKVIVSTPYEELIAEKGILNYEKVRQKYDIMIDFFKKNYNVDLQAIGDDVE